MIKVKATVKVKGPGFQTLIDDLAGGSITLGSQGPDAEKPHPNFNGTTGELMGRHELGLGVPERSWLRSFIDGNQGRLKTDMSTAMQHIIAGRKSRKKALEEIGFGWTRDMRQNISDGKIRPAIAASTAQAKGHDTPLIDTTEGVNSIIFKLFLKQVKSIKDASVREAVRRFGGK